MHKTLVFGFMMMVAQVAHADVGAKLAQGIQPRAATQAFSNKAGAQLRKIGEHARFGQLTKSEGSNAQSVEVIGTLDGRSVSRTVRTRQAATGGSASYMVSRGLPGGDSRTVYRKVQPIQGHAEGDALESVQFVDRDHSELGEYRETRELQKVFFVKDGQRGRQLSPHEVKQLSEKDERAFFHSGFNVGER